jgi:hypothetical protein
MISKLEGRSAAVLRNLAHNTKLHQLLMQSGAVDALADIMKQNKARTPLVVTFESKVF